MATIFKGSSEHSIVDIIFKGTSYATLYIKNKIFQLGQFVYNIVHQNELLSLSEQKLDSCAGTFNGYIFFKNKNIDIYDLSFVSYGPIIPSNQKRCIAVATLKNYILFGHSGSGQSIFIYDKEFTNIPHSNFESITEAPVAFSIGDYAVITGGPGSSVFNIYDQNLTFYLNTNLGYVYNRAAAVSNKNYAFIAGGNDTYYRNLVRAYDKNLTVYNVDSLSIGRSNLSAASVGDYVLFGGGLSAMGSSTNVYNTVDAYDKEMTKIAYEIAPLSSKSRDLAATTLGPYALFGGGYGSTHVRQMDIYDKELTKTNGTPLSQNRTRGAATSSDKYAFFGGGTQNNTIDVYKLEKIAI